MTSVRTVMTILTLGAAGVSYFYLQHTPVAGEPYQVKPSGPSLFDWDHDFASKGDERRFPTEELANQVHVRTKSVLDDFAIQNGGQSDAPVDDAFERLRQATQSLAPSTSSSVRDSSRWRMAEARLLNLNELQRTAFDPLADPVETEESEESSAPNRIVDPTGIPDPAPQSKTTAAEPIAVVEVAAAETEPTATSNKTSRTQPETQETIDTSISTVSLPKTTKSAASKPQEPVKRSALDTTRVDKAAAMKWKVVGHTTEKRPMHAVHLGELGTRTLVIAGLNGEDRTSVRWLEMLAEELSHYPGVLKNHEFIFFRAGNPDGLLRGQSTNSHGVALNRNFPSRRYRPTSDMPAFAAPASEVETRVMLDRLYAFRPRRVIHLMATSGRSQFTYNRSAKTVATDFEKSAKVEIAPLDAEQCPGSLEDFSDGTLEAAVMSIRLSVGTDWQQAWKTFQPHVLSAIVGQSIEPASDAVAEVDPDRTPIPVSNIEPVSRRPRRQGYEELPAPPE